MPNPYFKNTKYVSITILVFALATFTVPQAFAGAPPPPFIETPVNIDFMAVNSPPSTFNPAFSTSSILVLCTDPVVIGASITGNLLEIDDSPLFDSVDVSTSGLFCDGMENIISTAFLTDLTSYYVRLTVLTDVVDLTSSNVYFEPFVQPDAAILVLNDVGPGLITIKFRDIGVTDNIGPNIVVAELFPFEIGTLTVTDHNANIDLKKPETITVKINDVDTVLVETGDNTGIFTGPITSENSVSYNPGTLGVARATIVIDFETDVDGKGDIIIEDVLLTDEEMGGSAGFTPVTHPVRIAFDNGGMVKDGTDIVVTMSYADADLYPGDGDETLPLAEFTGDEMHEDSGGAPLAFDVGETVYLDADGDGFVSVDDIRLANAASLGPYTDGSKVIAGDSDEDIELVAFAPNEMHEDSGGALLAFDVGETVYFNLSIDVDDVVTAGDIRFANAASRGFSDGTAVRSADDESLLKMYYLRPETSYDVITSDFDDGSHSADLKTVVSNPTFETDFGPVYLGGHIVEGNYLLGFNTGSGGGGGGGISRAGFVVNALGFTKTLTQGGSAGNSPPSFGQSSFAIISGGEEGFGGILNDNDANTLEETKTFKVGEKAVLRFDFTEGGGIGKIEHIKLFTNVRDGQKRQDSDASISYDPLKSPPVTVHDPNGLFSEANFELLQIDVTKFVLKYELTFAKPMPTSDLIQESWNTKKWSTLNKIPNAIEVISSGIVQETASEPIVDTFTEDVTDDTIIPVWVKSNAKWWSDDKIDNDNFISGLEYLVNEGIIKVSLPEGTDNSISEIQPWIKSTAGWWADGMISEDEFITAIEWLITNNIIQVAA